MKNDYSLNFDTKVIFGCAKRAQLHNELECFERKMLICGKHFAKSSRSGLPITRFSWRSRMKTVAFPSINGRMT